MSRPVRALWIEISWSATNSSLSATSRPVRALWIEIATALVTTTSASLSRPVRALWIEMLPIMPLIAFITVEAREGLVD